MEVRGPAEQAESTETERFKKSRGPLLSAPEAGPRTELPADETLERRDRGLPATLHRLRAEDLSPRSERSEEFRIGYRP